MKLPLNHALRVLLTTNGLVLLAPVMLGPIYAIYVERIGGDLLDAGFTAAIFSLSAGLTCLASGYLSDEYKNPRLIVILGSLIMSLGFLGYLWVDSIWQLFLVQAIVGLGEAIYYPPYDALYSSHLNGFKKATGWAAWESMSYFITAFGAFIGALIVNRFGFDLLFILMSILCTSSAIILTRLQKSAL